MTINEQRLAWRFYVTAAMVAMVVTKDSYGEICDVADEMVTREMERFKRPDHIAEADKTVEPRTFVGLTEEELGYLHDAYFRPGGELDQVLQMAEDILHKKNVGTR